MLLLARGPSALSRVGWLLLLLLRGGWLLGGRRQLSSRARWLQGWGSGRWLDFSRRLEFFFTLAYTQTTTKW